MTLYRSDLEAMLRRCNKADRERVLAYFDDAESRKSYRHADADRRATELEDLRIIVKDQRNHIRNLEDQLLPYLKGPQAEQGALV